MGYHVLVTGHYASLNGGMWEGEDLSKDQTYFLCTTRIEDFKGVHFPLEHTLKGGTRMSSTGKIGQDYKGVLPEVKSTLPIPAGAATTRDIAAHFNLPSASAPDSTGICFVNPPPTSTGGSSVRGVGGVTDFNAFLSSFTEIPERNDRMGIYSDIDTGSVVGSFEITETNNPLLLTMGQSAKIPGARVKYFVAGRGETKKGEGRVIKVAGGTRNENLYRDRVEVMEGFNFMDGNMGENGRAMGR